MADLGPSPKVDPAYERFARLVQAHLGVPIALVGFVEADGQRLPGAMGLPEPWQSLRATPLTHSFCKHVVAQDRPLVVSDARTVSFLRDNPAIPEIDVIAYAGYPLHDLRGQAVGSLCAIHTSPREWTPAELAVLEDLALACSSEVQLREAAATADAAVEVTARRAVHAQILLALSDAFTQTRTPDDVLDATQRAAADVAGAARSSVAIVHPERRMLTWARHADVPGAPPNLWADSPLDRLDSPTVSAVVSRRPLFFDDGDAMGAAFPGLKGVGGNGAAAFLPLTTSTATLGAVLLRWREPRVLDDGVRDLLSTLASDASTALERAQLLQSRTDVARTLQAAMLSHLPEPAGVDLDAVYLPADDAEQVGGDWYDAMELSDGGFAVVVGDVTGHDMPAATRMGQLRSMLRALLWEHDKPPSLVLELLDQANMGSGLGATATAFLARLSPPTSSGIRRLTWSSAGHPPAFVRRAGARVAAPGDDTGDTALAGARGTTLGDGTGSTALAGARGTTRGDGTGGAPAGSCVVLDGRPDLPLGFIASRERHDHVVELAPGDTLVVYTDGLLERRTESLRTSIDAAVPIIGTLESWGAAAIVDALGPTGDRGDDVVVLTLHIHD